VCRDANKHTHHVQNKAQEQSTEVRDATDVTRRRARLNMNETKIRKRKRDTHQKKKHFPFSPLFYLLVLRGGCGFYSRASSNI
jgi:hypothetical protein